MYNRGYTANEQEGIALGCVDYEKPEGSDYERDFEEEFDLYSYSELLNMKERKLSKKDFYKSHKYLKKGKRRFAR